MSVRFRKSIGFGPFRLNLNTKSASITTKVGPFRRTVGTRGTTDSVNLPEPFSWVRFRSRQR